MGEVFLALHRGLNKPVVVKLLHRQFIDDPRFADRLRVEAQALAALDSPHVVSVSDLGCTPEGRPYLVLERLHGRTLRDELRERGALPIGEAIEITRQVLEGLHAAHRLHIVHRDVKSDNIFLCSDPSGAGASMVKVLDFGIAKVLDMDGAAPVLASPQYPTEEGVMVGSPRTVAPEQIRFQPVDARTDIYAVGLLLYTMIAGRPPFAHVGDLLELLNAHLEEAPRAPSAYARQPVPAALDRAILKALAKSPQHRFQSALELSDELGRIAVALGGATQQLRLIPVVQSFPTPTALVDDDESTTASGAMDATARGTLVMRPAASAAPPAPPSSGARAIIDAEMAAWFEPAHGALPITALPTNLSPLPAPVPAPVEMRTFAVITLACTVVFSVLVALAFRLLDAR
jgi:serine/threonine-protein kinase